MIRYALNCKNGHQFESWFQSAEAYDKLLGAGMVSCSVCGGTDVEKGLMAPRLSKSEQAEATPPAVQDTPETPENPLAEIRKKIEETSDYVGDSFASEARAMHLGDAPERAIHGEAKPEEARALLEEGVPLVPLPFLPSRKTN